MRGPVGSGKTPGAGNVSSRPSVRCCVDLFLALFGLLGFLYDLLGFLYGLLGFLSHLPILRWVKEKNYCCRRAEGLRRYNVTDGWLSPPFLVPTHLPYSPSSVIAGLTPRVSFRIQRRLSTGQRPRVSQPLPCNYRNSRRNLLKKSTPSTRRAQVSTLSKPPDRAGLV